MKHRSKRRSRSRDRRRSSSSSSLYSDEPQQETNAAYELYMKLKRERERAEGNPVKCRSLDLETDFPNYKRKLVVQHIPSDQTAPQILDYFYGILAQVSSEAYTKNPILSVEKDRYKDLGFVTLEFRKREDADICLNLDGTKYSSQQQTPIKIQRCKRFVIFWNDEISRGRNPAAEALGIRVKERNFQDTGMGGDAFYEDRRIFMGGIPPQMQEDEVRQMCESFGRLKNFNLIKDSGQLNKGYAFFEYHDERAIDKAIRHLNQLEIKDKRLKVQRASEGVQKSTVLCMHAAVPPEKQLPLPMHCSTPSRVIQVLNMLPARSLLDLVEVERVKMDLIAECKKFGDIIKVEIPMPNQASAVARLPQTALVSYAHGKLFVKFSHIIAAKQARHGLSGRTYNGSTVVVSYYPEHYFDIHEFGII